MKKFTSIKDITDPMGWVQQAITIKKAPNQSQIGKGKTLGLLFFNPSLRTRLSTQKAAQNLGMHVMTMDITTQGWQLSFEDGAVMNGNSQEHIKEAAMVMSTYCDLIGIRSFPELQNQKEDYSERILTSFLQHSTCPVLSLESATLHPLQSLADMITIEELKKKPKPKVVLSWAPHPKALPQAVANSFSEWALGCGHDLTIACPEGFSLSPTFTKGATVLHNQEQAFEGADFVYVKNWSSYENYGQINQNAAHWIMDEQKQELTNAAKVMHCLPVRRNVVIADSIMDGPFSAIPQQTENRIYAAQTALTHLLS